MKKTLLLAGASLTLLSGCNTYRPFGQGADIDINGEYVGRVIGNMQDSAVLDVTVLERDLAVTATIKSRANGQTYRLTGTRSVYRSTPVQVNLAGSFGVVQCNGYAERYTAAVTFVEFERGSAEGYMNHFTCVAGQWQGEYDNSGRLELTRK